MGGTGCRRPTVYAAGFLFIVAGFALSRESRNAPPGAASIQARAPVDFETHVRPLLKRSCYPCHGPGMQNGGLRLDRKAAALAGGLSGRAILPGDGTRSILYRRIAGLDDLVRMPMQGEKLDDAEIELIRAWIDQGAHWPDAEPVVESRAPVKHWAYIPPATPALPSVRSEKWARNPIDRFILEKIESAGLEHSGEASRETLLRRLSLDLIGLPPTLEEIDSFVSDHSPDAYEKAVDRLLASPRYGERWARPWLDLARYSDTNGYEKDNRRSMWLYRDWVIDALNRDVPFDQFTVEQIAGDLLPNATSAQKIATGFHRNTMINEEGGIDPEEFRIAAIYDRVDTTATVWLGSTLACAQCHNHKFDPFTQEDYYRFFAFFNSTEEELETFAGSERRSRPPNFTVPPPAALAAHRRRVEDRIAELEADLNRASPELLKAQRKWEESARKSLVPWHTLVPVSATSAAGSRLRVLEDGSVHAVGRAPDQDTYLLVSRIEGRSVTGVRLEALNPVELPGEAASQGDGGGFILTGIELEVAGPSDQSPRAVKFADAASLSGSSVKSAIDDDPARGWTYRPSGPPEETHAVFLAETPFGDRGPAELRIRLRQESQTPRQLLRRFRLSVTTGSDPLKSSRIPVDIQAVLDVPAEERSTAQAERLDAYYRQIAPETEPIRERLGRLRALWKDLASPSTFVMKELPEPRKTHVHLRGSYLDPGKEVQPGVSAVLHPLRADGPPDRLALARWLVDPQNPLVARVTMNRMWRDFFGRGLVETVEDFGSQGARPSHPGLLDWLATEFVRREWSMKAMHRLVVTSATYRQQSAVTPLLKEKDPENRLLARAPRMRLEAELLRDNALAIAGLLSPRIGGPSVFPPQPEGIWNLVYNSDTWVLSEGEDRYRRGLYTFSRRTAPYPMFLTFDAPSREAICTRRPQTNTPLQALTLLNDPVFFDAARGLARRILSEPDRDLEAAVALAFRLSTGRAPDGRELSRLTALHDEELRHFRKSPRAATAVSIGGDVAAPEGIDHETFATWVIVSNVLLNLDETVTRE